MSPESIDLLDRSVRPFSLYGPSAAITQGHAKKRFATNSSHIDIFAASRDICKTKTPSLLIVGGTLGIELPSGT
jgi:hypothetical protein